MKGTPIRRTYRPPSKVQSTITYRLCYTHIYMGSVSKISAYGSSTATAKTPASPRPPANKGSDNCYTLQADGSANAARVEENTCCNFQLALRPAVRLTVHTRQNNITFTFFFVHGAVLATLHRLSQETGAPVMWLNVVLPATFSRLLSIPNSLSLPPTTELLIPPLRSSGRS